MAKKDTNDGKKWLDAITALSVVAGMAIYEWQDFKEKIPRS